MRLIDADALNKFPIRTAYYDKEHGNKHFVLGIESVLEFAEQLPTIDAVEVTRCKDCQYYAQTDCFGEACCNTFLRHSTVLIPRKPDDYCSHGKPKDMEVL